MINKIFKIETNGLGGELKDNKIILTIQPDEFLNHEDKEIVLMQVYQELQDYIEFLEHKSNKKSNSLIVNSEKLNTKDEAIKQGAYKGQTIDEVYEKEGKRAIEYLKEKGDNKTKKSASSFLKLLEGEQYAV